VEEFRRRLGRLRIRLRLERTARAGARWAFYASFAVSAVLAGSKVLGRDLPAPLWGAFLAAVPLAAALREWARSFSLRDCAIQLDLRMGLEERLSTAVECPGALGGALHADAARMLDRLDPPPFRLPREARFLGGGFLLLAALAVVPAPGRRGWVAEPGLQEAAQVLAERLDVLASEDPPLARAAELLREGRLEEALEVLRAEQARIEREIVEAGGGAGPRAERLREAVAEAAAGLAAQLAAAGRVIHAPPPGTADLKLRRQAAGTGGAAGERREPVRGAVADPEAILRALADLAGRPGWGPRYDAVIRRYFLGEAP